MKLKFYVVAICATFFMWSSLSAQKTYDLGLYLGGTNYVGEIGDKSFITPNSGFFGAIGKLNFNDKIAIRGSLVYMQLQDDDRDAKDNFRGGGRAKSLYYSFENRNIEGTIALEYTPFELFNIAGAPVSPYVYAGVSVLYGDELYYPMSPGNEDVVAIDYGNRTRTAIPLGIGIKSLVTPRIQIGIEFSTHLSFTDNLDGTEPDLDQLEDFRFSYFQKNDIYNYLGLTLTYRFGKGAGGYCNCGL